MRLTLTQRVQAIQPLMQRIDVQPITIPIQEWMPDLPTSQNPGMITLKNVYPAPGGVRPFGQLSKLAGGIQGKCIGASSARSFSGTNYVYAGTVDKLWEAGTAFTDVSKAAGYTTDEDENWNFQQFQNAIIATNYSNPIQSKNLGTADQFADMVTGTTKPQARHLAVLGRYLLIGNTFDGTDGVRPNRVWWTPDPTNFDPSIENQIDFEDFTDGGDVKGIVGNLEFGLVFQQSAIRRMAIVPTIQFDIDPIDRMRGTPFSRSIGWTGRRAYFWAEDGFHYNDGSGSVGIGIGKVDSTFRRFVDSTRRSEISTAVDRTNSLVMWAVPSGSTSKRLFMFNYNTNGWSEAEVNLEVLTEFRTTGSDLDDPTAPDPILDDTTWPDLDSEFWKGGILKLGGIFGGDLLTAGGLPQVANMVTGEFLSIEMSRMRYTMREIRPLIEGKVDTSVRVGYRDSLDDPVVWTPWSFTTNGKSSVRVNGRYLRIEIETASGQSWSFAKGVRCKLQADGVNP